MNKISTHKNKIKFKAGCAGAGPYEYKPSSVVTPASADPVLNMSSLCSNEIEVTGERAAVCMLVDHIVADCELLPPPPLDVVVVVVWNSGCVLSRLDVVLNSKKLSPLLNKGASVDVVNGVKCVRK